MTFFSVRYIKDKIIGPKIYQKIVSGIIEALADVPFVSCTSDIWTADHNKSAFISLTCHWLTSDFYQQHVVLKCSPFNESHNAENIADKTLEGLHSFLIPVTNVHLVLRDAASNISAGIR